MKFLLTEYFKKQLKQYLRKDRSLAEKLEDSLTTFQQKFAVSIGKGIYKIRVRAQNKGKSGGYRVYLLLLEVKGFIVPLCIYAKNDRENLGPKELKEHLNAVLAELSLY